MSDFVALSFGLPSNGKNYGNVAEFKGLKMKHYKHMAMFSEPSNSMATKFESALEVISDVIKIDGLNDYKKLYGMDFDFLMLNMRVFGTPDQREFRFSWKCSCVDKNSASEMNYVNDAVYDLCYLMQDMKLWNGETFFLNEHEYSFITVGDWIDIYRIVETMVSGLHKKHEKEVERLLREKDIEENLVEYERKRLMKRLVQFDEFNSILEYRIAAHLVAPSVANVAAVLEAKKKIVDEMDFNNRQKLLEMVDTLGSFGVHKHITQKCVNCGVEARIKFPFQQLVRFI